MRLRAPCDFENRACLGLKRERRLKMTALILERAGQYDSVSTMVDPAALPTFPAA